MSVDLPLWRSSGWRTGRSWHHPAALESAFLMAQHVWRSAQSLNSMLVTTSARLPMRLAANSAKPKSLSKVKKKKKVKSPQICTLRFYLFVIVFISQKLKNSDFCCFWESFICSLSSCRETWSSSVSCWSSSSFSIQKNGQSVLHWRA